MKGDYGFRSGPSRLYEAHYGEVPASGFKLAFANFQTEWLGMRRTFVKDEFSQVGTQTEKKGIVPKISMAFGGVLVKVFMAIDAALVRADIMKPIEKFDEPVAPANPDEAEQVRKALSQLKLDSKKVDEMEKERFKLHPPEAPWFIQAPYYALCILLDLIYEGRPIQRFWVLEEVARMPYFAYISMLHLYESFGWWRAGAALRKVHFAEEWNELHHLQIMESLGGDNAWIDRFVASHSAVAYFWALIAFYAISPKQAYAFSELVEGHATDTYHVFAQQNEELLKSLPPPAVAVAYYKGDDVYMFRSFQTSEESREHPRNPSCDNLYDVFINIRDDEIEHRKTMIACQDPEKIARDIAAAARAPLKAS